MYNEKIKEVIGNCLFKENEPLSGYTGFKTGGCADIIAFPQSKCELISVVNSLRQNSIPYFILGNGSNVLALDSGFRGCIIKTDKALKNFQILEETVWCEAGNQLSFLCSECAKNNLSGLEFAFGIPGTFGGAIYMNAGAYGGEMKDVVESVSVLDNSGNVLELSNEKMDFSYRNSAAQIENYIILGAKLKLIKKSSEQIFSAMNDYLSRRKEKQPLDKPSCGSTFKRPEGAFASKLIDDCGLRGFSVGGAQVSEKHCGFVINKGNATSQDIINIVDEIKNIVKEKTGYQLECEIKIIG